MPNRAGAEAMEQFHTHEYIHFLQHAKPGNVSPAQSQHFNVGPGSDSPIFDGVYKFCQIYAGASVHGAQKLIQEDHDIAINWAGGLHHAKKGEAEGTTLNTSLRALPLDVQQSVVQWQITCIW